MNLQATVDAWTASLVSGAAWAALQASLMIFIAVALLRSALLWMLVRTHKLPDDLRLRLKSVIRNGTWAILAAACFWLWAPTLRNLVLAAAALAVAMTIGTKEITTCILGSMLRASGRVFEVGDRIQIAGRTGDVIDQSWLTTTILEIGPTRQRTGRAIVLPNSLFFTDVIINETFTKEYVLHTFDIHVGRRENWRHNEAALLSTAHKVCAPFLHTAQVQMDAIARKNGLKPRPVTPRVDLRLSDPEWIVLSLRVPTPAREKARVEQMILRQYLERLPSPPKDSHSRGTHA
ncbi:MAG: mechanosensitive ion channel domain-containing protein [Polyangiales bacterium]